MHKSARGFGYPSDSSWTERQRTRGAQAQLADDRPRLLHGRATTTLRRRPTPPPTPLCPIARPGAVPPGPGRRRTRRGREQASVSAPCRTAGTGAASTGRLSAPDWAGLHSIFRRASNTGWRASPVRSGPWGLPGLPAGGAGSRCWHAAADQWFAQSVSGSDQGCSPWISGSFVQCGDDGLDPPVPKPRDVHPGHPPAPWISGALSPRARRQSSRAVRCGAPGPLPPRVDRRGLRHRLAIGHSLLVTLSSQPGLGPDKFGRPAGPVRPVPRPALKLAGPVGGMHRAVPRPAHPQVGYSPS
jgi:hypothetical protein